MGRTSRLFPSSGRKASITSQSSANTSRESQPQLSKAERLLGATGLPDASRQHLPRRPSHISLQATSISEFGEEAKYDDFSSPDHFGLEPLPLRLANLQQDGAQDRGARQPVPGASHSRSFTSDHRRKVKGSWSSATLNTCYEYASTEWSRPQHPSHSAGCDRTLSSGLAQVSEPEHRHRPSTASANPADHSRANSIDQATALPDMSRLHPRAGRMSQQHAMPPASSSASSRFPGVAPTSKPSTGAGSLKKVAGNATKSLKSHLSVESLPQSIKFFSWRSQASTPAPMRSRPVTKTKATKHWWDNFPLEQHDSDAESEHDPNLVTPTETIFPASTRGAPSPGLSDLHTSPGRCTDNANRARKTGSSQDIISARSSITVRSPRKPASRVSRHGSKINVNDLHQTSVLSISSSSESEPESDTDEEEHTTHHIRDSIAASEIDVHHVGQAQVVALNTMRRMPQQAVLDRRTSSASISSVTDSSSVQSGNQGPAYLSVPNRTRKSGHTRQPSSIPEDSDNSSQIASPASTPGSTRSLSAPQADNRKLMAVTEEEEALLEMMRRKRADKAAQRDSGMASVASSTGPRPFSNLSGSSSILDSFPISRSQRSSLLASRAHTQQILESSAELSKSDRGCKRQSTATTATENTYYSINSRLESPTRLKYAFSTHLPLAKLDVSLARLQPLNPDEAPLPSPEPVDEPRTLFMRYASADVTTRDDRSKHDSIASYAYGDRSQATEELIKERLGEKMRRKTTSSATRYAPSQVAGLEKPATVAERSSYMTASSDEESSLRVGTEDGSSTDSSKRASTLSKNTSECDLTCDHAGCSGSLMRCSVSADVLDAWSGLGGWREGSGSMMA